MVFDVFCVFGKGVKIGQNRPSEAQRPGEPRLKATKSKQAPKEAKRSRKTTPKEWFSVVPVWFPGRFWPSGCTWYSYIWTYVDLFTCIHVHMCMCLLVYTYSYKGIQVASNTGIPVQRYTGIRIYIQVFWCAGLEVVRH